MRKKGQAAMEFLMTYGWAILAAVIVIAVLAALGVFSPGTYVSNACTMSQPFGCSDTSFSITDVGGAGTDTIDLDLTNGRGEAIYLLSLTIQNCGTYTPSAGGGDCPTGTTGGTDADGNTYCTQPDGTEITYTITCTSDIASGDRFTGSITANYEVSTATGSRDLSSTGKITGKVA